MDVAIIAVADGADTACSRPSTSTAASHGHLPIALNYVWPIRRSEQVYDMRNSVIKNPVNAVCTLHQ